jgi:replicative DNA helicase
MLADDARRIKVLARQLDIVIYLLVQLNDEVAPEDTPEIRHIRESKGPSNHADVILLMSAPDGISHNPTDENNHNHTQRRHLWVRKWRGVGAFSEPLNLSFNGASQRFINHQN